MGGMLAHTCCERLLGRERIGRADAKDELVAGALDAVRHAPQLVLDRPEFGEDVDSIFQG